MENPLLSPYQYNVLIDVIYSIRGDYPGFLRKNFYFQQNQTHRIVDELYSVYERPSDVEIGISIDCHVEM